MRLLATIPLVYSHGSMVKPASWHDPAGLENWFSSNGTGNAARLGCGQLDFDLPYNQITGKQPDCVQMWFSGGNPIQNASRNRTISDEAFQPEVTCKDQVFDPSRGKSYSQSPWAAPGTAPVYSSCGTMGGKMIGCQYNYQGTQYDCCAEDCGTFQFGPSAERYPPLYENAIETVWALGSVQEVGWYVQANHGGGYAYRLCKFNEDHDYDAGVSEECFNAGHLSFVGDKQWIQFRRDKKTGERTEITARRVKRAGFPSFESQIHL